MRLTLHARRGGQQVCIRLKFVFPAVLYTARAIGRAGALVFAVSAIALEVRRRGRGEHARGAFMRDGRRSQAAIHQTDFAALQASVQ